MKMSNGEKMIFAAHFSYMLKNGRSCTLEDCINNAAEAVVLLRSAKISLGAATFAKVLSEEAKGMLLEILSDKQEEDC